MKYWMCLNCTDENGVRGKKFWSDVPVCSCGVDLRKPEHKTLMVRCVILHYVPPDPVVKGRGVRFRLCDGKSVRLHNPEIETSTGSRAAVDCPACLAHKDFPGKPDEL